MSIPANGLPLKSTDRAVVLGSFYYFKKTNPEKLFVK